MRLNIGPRLTLCFVFIILSMLGGDAVILWQFHVVRAQAEHLNGFDEKLNAVLRVHTSLLAFHDRLESLADSEDAGRLVAEAGPLHAAILEGTQRAKNTLSVLPKGLQRDPTILLTIEVIQGALQSQLDAITTLASAGDWSAVHLRLAYQVHPLESLTSSLVEKVDREVGEEQADSVRNIRRVEQQVFVIVPLTVAITLLIATTLGLSITRSITHPLARLVEGSRMLARGEFQHRVSIHGDDELSRLGQVFNDTAAQLQSFYASLQSSEDRLRRVINTIPAIVTSMLPDGSVDFINARLLEFTGCTPEDLSGWKWGTVCHPDDLPGTVAASRQALASGEPMEFEVRIRRADGAYRWFLVRYVPLRDESGKIVKWYGTAIEIEDRKRAEAQLRRNEVYLAEAQRLSRTGSFAWQFSTDEIVWSEETYHIFGYDSTTTPTLEMILERAHPDDKDLVEDILGQALSTNGNFDVEHRLLMPDGAVKYLHVVAHGIRDGLRRLESIGAVTDVTPAKEAEEALRNAQADLAHVNRVTTMGELSASLAHEINQPIAAAVINAHTCQRWLRRDQPDLDEAREAAARMADDINRAAVIIGRIRQFFKKGTAPREPVDVNETIREMIGLLHNEATRYSVSFRTELAEDLPLVEGDRVQLQQVLMNLMINSFDAMKTVEGVRQITIHSQRTNDAQVLVSIEDTGMGLPPQQADQIFSAFFTTKRHGLGMGLRISRSIIESHGGRLWAEDNRPRGAVLHFTLTGQRSVGAEKGSLSHNTVEH